MNLLESLFEFCEAHYLDDEGPEYLPGSEAFGDGNDVGRYKKRRIWGKQPPDGHQRPGGQANGRGQVAPKSEGAGG